MSQTDPLKNCKNCSRRNNIFALLNDEELALVDQHRYEVTFNKGEIIFKQGSPLTHVACITEGLAKLYIEGLNKRNLILSFAKPVQMVGGPGIFNDYIHHFSVAAIEETTACLVDTRIVEGLIERNSIFACDLLKRANQISIDNFKKFINLTQKQMNGRMADAFLFLMDDIYGRNPFILTVSRQDIADLTAMSKENVIRVMKTFKDHQLIRVEGNLVEIINKKELVRISETG
ncbi:MAG TPA: Crp/Fnr family transcriptional regulator [Lentimicrobium sp.]|nr:Crp/Fnr family transcriptional regulator [Lentimicrobium sp.]